MSSSRGRDARDSTRENASDLRRVKGARCEALVCGTSARELGTFAALVEDRALAQDWTIVFVALSRRGGHARRARTPSTAAAHGRVDQGGRGAFIPFDELVDVGLPDSHLIDGRSVPRLTCARSPKARLGVDLSIPHAFGGYRSRTPYRSRILQFDTIDTPQLASRPTQGIRTREPSGPLCSRH